MILYDFIDKVGGKLFTLMVCVTLISLAASVFFMASCEAKIAPARYEARAKRSEAFWSNSPNSQKWNNKQQKAE